MNLHKPTTFLVGGPECLDRECEDYFTDTGEPDPTVDRCAHISEETVCRLCSVPDAYGEYETAVAWPCPYTTAHDPWVSRPWAWITVAPTLAAVVALASLAGGW